MTDSTLTPDSNNPLTDDYGYSAPPTPPVDAPLVPAPAATPAAGGPPAPAATPAPVVTPAADAQVQPVENKSGLTGYKKPEEVPVPPPVESPTPVDPNDAPEVKLKREIETVLDQLPKEKKAMSEFAIAHKLSKEQVEAYVNLRKVQDSEVEKLELQKVKEQRDSWYNELKNDATFGKENFDKNLDRVGKVLEKFLPNTSKILTERQSMMPPYIMRDLLSLDEVLNPIAPLVPGGPSTPPPESEHYLDYMYK